MLSVTVSATVITLEWVVQCAEHSHIDLVLGVILYPMLTYIFYELFRPLAAITVSKLPLLRCLQAREATSLYLIYLPTSKAPQYCTVYRTVYSFSQCALVEIFSTKSFHSGGSLQFRCIITILMHPDSSAAS